MSVMEGIRRRMFGRPSGVLGRLGGLVMARVNRAFAHAVVQALQLQPGAKVLEVGFGPGVAIEHLIRTAHLSWIAGIDSSAEMLAQAKARNADAIRRGLVDLRHGSVHELPFENDTFDLALAINSLQVWPDAVAGLREIWRVLKRGGRVALGFTPHSGQSRPPLPDVLSAAGFTDVAIQDIEGGFCVFARKPAAAGRRAVGSLDPST